MSILIKPIITEKATKDSEIFNRYAFVVNKQANKLEIKGAVESTYGVAVKSVRTLIQPAERKTKYTKKGLVTGLTSGYKKAIVQLADGEVIDFYNNI
ncbi:MAG TPA: 50S ribosomal protein L23 [Tenacibaculum sp.]|uniref:50S ribosomal protein L23 n=1 Tax=Tenacibaculum sp. C7A-26P2 TaxID=3447504 RepID=UPI000E891F37|nr:50S ribosomal protein L23 [Tenacibaculum sp.]